VFFCVTESGILDVHHSPLPSTATQLRVSGTPRHGLFEVNAYLCVTGRFLSLFTASLSRQHLFSHIGKCVLVEVLLFFCYQ
jgi:hypothetical protein